MARLFLVLLGALALIAPTSSAAPLGAGATPSGSDSTSDAVVIAVGDISCSPESKYFAAGLGQGLQCRQLATADAASSQAPEAVLALGDLQYEKGQRRAFRASFAQSWGRFLHRTDRTRNLIWPVPGNHEYGNGSRGYQRARGYFSYFNGGSPAAPRHRGVAGRNARGWYTRTIGTWRVFALNDNCDYLRRGCQRGSAQYRWLRSQLQRNTSQCVLAYWHKPLFTDGEHAGSTDGKHFWRLLQRYGTDVVLSGHNHSYERFGKLDVSGRRNSDGIRQFVVGTGGKNLYPLGSRRGPASQTSDATTSGVLRLDLKAQSYSWNFVRAEFVGNGSFADSGSTACN